MTRVPPSAPPATPGLASRHGHANEPHSGGLAARLNWLRAGVLGASDGIVSTAGLVVGVAAATTARSPIITAGIAGLAAGAVAMALGEYVSVSSQRDTEQALLKERAELAADPERELSELTAIYQAKGLTPRIGGVSPSRAVGRVVLGGALAMLVTFGIGQLVGAVAS